MRLSIPTNWADDFFEKVDLSAVTEIYGKLTSDFVGGGRASVLLKKLPLKRFNEHIKEISKRGIVFNYLLNATCLSNKEFSIKGHKEICKLLDFISEHDIPMVTVGLPQLVMLIKSKYPHLKVSVSTNSMVDNLERVKYWEEHGVDQITISYTDLNRDFKELARMTKNAKCELQTICNFICRRHCPQQFFHGAYNSHASQTGTLNSILPIDFYLLTCITRFFTNPYEIIRSSFIRPEDLVHFENIGLDKFKLGERGINTEDLSRIVTAYTNRSYDGNLIDLVPTMSKYKIVTEPSLMHMLKYYVRPGMIRISKVLPALRAMKEFTKNEAFYKSIGLYIDNKGLDGFIEHFLDHSCHDKTCEECGWCDAWAAKVIKKTGYENSKIDPIKVIGDIKDGLAKGTFFE